MATINIHNVDDFSLLQNSNFLFISGEPYKILNIGDVDPKGEGRGRKMCFARRGKGSGHREWARDLGAKNVKVVAYPIHPFTFTLPL